MQIFKKSAAIPAARACLVALIATATAGSPALGQNSGSWRCAADNGQYAENPQPLLTGVRTLSGRILFERGLSPDGQWDPIANIGFSTSGSGGNCNCAGVMARVHSSQPDIVTFYVVANGQEVGFAQGPVGRPLSFHLSIDDAGVLTASIGKTKPTLKSIRLNNPRHNALRMSCSTAVVTFLDLQTR